MRKMTCIFALLIFGSLFAKEDRIDEYFNFIQLHKGQTQTFGDYKRGEIEIVRDRKKIREIEQMQKRRFKKMGLSEAEAIKASEVGIISKDTYWIWIRDAVIFPTGAEGTYNRLIWVSSLENGTPGVAILPVLSDGRVALILNFRHAIRQWVLELPRGLRQEKETIEETVNRELREETGLYVANQHFLGKITPDSGIMSSEVPVYMGTIRKKGVSNQDYSEAILRYELFTVNELKEALSKGWIEMDIKGEKEKVGITDSFITFALLQAEYKKLL